MANVKTFLPGNVANARDKLTQALLTAVTDQDTNMEVFIQACIDQMFLATADGQYLIQLGEQQGFTMPPNSGLDIRAYRVLVPLMVSAPKQVRQTIDQLVAAFYGTDRTQPSMTSALPEPYNLASGDDITIETESGVINVAIQANQVSDITNVSAGELAAVLNTIQNLFTADTVVNRSNNLNYIRLTSKATGVSAFIRVVGGTMQNVIRLPFLRQTAQTTGTTWLVTKPAVYSDFTTFTWDGAGINPLVYLVQPGDTVSIRGLFDGLQNQSLLNGGYHIVDCGYDYFVIRNEAFDAISTTVTQVSPFSFIFTSSKPARLYDLPEYATSSEHGLNTASVTVPAIPPLARRFLQGSAHLHGYLGQVISFSRGDIQVQFPAGLELATATNSFVFASDHQRFDFRHLSYQTTSRDNNPTQPTYSVDASGDNAVLPFTLPQPTGTSPFYARPGSEEIIVTFDTPHGLYRGWGFTLAGATGDGNINSYSVNAEHIVERVINKYSVAIKLLTGTGAFLKYSGVSFGTFDVARQATTQLDGSDFYLTFPNNAAVIASGLQPGSLFRLDTSGGVTINSYLSTKLRYLDLVVRTVGTTIVTFTSGLDVGPQGTVITGETGYRDGHFGSSPTYFFDLTSTNNQTNVLAGMTALFQAATPQVNPAYLGSYMYDPLGKDTTVAVSGFIARTTTELLRGSNENIVLVDNVKSVLGGQDFPATGQLVIDYGTSDFEGPIRYIAVIANDTGPSQIVLDPSYRYKNSHAPGAAMQFVRATTPYVPNGTGSDYPFYVTGTAQARNTLFAMLELLVASGVFLDANVLLPTLRYSDPAIGVFD